jgi:hypothetical protein
MSLSQAAADGLAAGAKGARTVLVTAYSGAAG